MGPEDIHQIITETIWTILLASGPVLVVAMVVGLGIALFQALTSVQEMTLTFVPKVAAIFVTIGVSLPFMYMTLVQLADMVFDVILSGNL